MVTDQDIAFLVPDSCWATERNWLQYKCRPHRGHLQKQWEWCVFLLFLDNLAVVLGFLDNLAVIFGFLDNLAVILGFLDNLAVVLGFIDIEG